MKPQSEDSEASGILIAVLIGGLILVAVGIVAFLFLGTGSSTSYSVPASSSTSAPAAPEEPTTSQALDTDLEGMPAVPDEE